MDDDDLDIWRITNGPLRHTPLRLTREVDDAELAIYQQQIAAETAIAVRAHSLAEVEASWRGALDAFIGPVDDVELDSALEQIQRPLIYDDPRFGRFTLDRRVDWFEAEVSWNSAPVRLAISCDSSRDSAPGLAVANALWNDAAEWARRVSEFAIEQLLPLKNDCWLDEDGEDEQELDDAAFLARMSLQSITIYGDGALEFWHDDGDLFFGHSILVSGTLSGGLTDANIPG